MLAFKIGLSLDMKRLSRMSKSVSEVSRFKIQELYLTTVKTHQDTYYKQLHKQNYKYKKKNIYIYMLHWKTCFP